MLLQNIEALISNHTQHSLVQIIIPETQERFQSIIVGFDAYENEVLLGGLYPSPKLKTMEHLATQNFWIQCEYEGQFLNICVEAKEVMLNADLISVSVLNSKLTNNRRWSPRANFDNHQGPKVDILPLYGAVEQGWVKNLSYHGALIECYGHDIRNKMLGKNTVSIRIKFNKDFYAESRITVKQCYFRRSPCRHTSIRVMFDNLPEIESHYIRDFINQVPTSSLVA